MSNKKNHNRKWLITRLKASGSKRRYVIDGDYSDERNSKSNKDWENLPSHQGMGKSFKFYNSKINYGLLVRFLRGKIGTDWNQVYDEVMERIPIDLIEYKDCLKWFVSDLIEKREDGLWDKREQKYLLIEPNKPYDNKIYIAREFYVDPDSNILVKIKDFPSNRKTKGMGVEQLRGFRENEKKARLEEKRVKKSEIESSKENTKDLLKKNKRNE